MHTHVFDIDDTLVLTDGKIKVVNPLNGVRLLSAKEFTKYQQHPHDSFDFSEFNDVDKLMNGTLVKDVCMIIRDCHDAGERIAVITAREQVWQIVHFLKECIGVTIPPEMVLAVNEKPRRFFGDNVPEMKRQAIKHLIESGSSKIDFYDDDPMNLELAAIESAKHGIPFRAIHVDDKWHRTSLPKRRIDEKIDGFAGILKLITGMSNASTSKVGCLALNKDFRNIAAFGWNGSYSGAPTNPETGAEEESLEPGMSGFIHAEVNMIAKFREPDPQNYIVLCSLSPCAMCTKILVNSGFKMVYWIDTYRETNHLRIFQECGVMCGNIDDLKNRINEIQGKPGHR